jgi:hypothetical protein
VVVVVHFLLALVGLVNPRHDFYIIHLLSQALYDGLLSDSRRSGGRRAFTCHFSNRLTIHRTKLEKADELYKNHAVFAPGSFTVTHPNPENTTSVLGSRILNSYFTSSGIFGGRRAFTCHFSNRLTIHRTKLEKADELYKNHAGDNPLKNNVCSSFNWNTIGLISFVGVISFKLCFPTLSLLESLNNPSYKA